MSDGLFDMFPDHKCWGDGCNICNYKEVPVNAILNAASDWRYKADGWFNNLPSGSQFTSESVTERVGFPAGQQASNRNNAVGAWMMSKASKGLIHKVEAVASQNNKSHGATIWIWRKR